MSTSATVLFCNIEPSTAQQLSALFHGVGCHTADHADSLNHVDLVLCEEGQSLDDVLHRARKERAHTPVIAVGRHASESRWIQAIEQGASDYLCADSEPIQVRWLLKSVLRSNRRAA